MANLMKIASLWAGTDKTGDPIISGNVSAPVGVVLDLESRIVILTNKRKEADNHPDYELYVTKNEPRE